MTVPSAVDPLLAEAAKLRLGLDLANAETEPRFVSSSRQHGATTAHELPM